MLYNILLKGAPISFILLVLLSYVVGVFLYFLYFFMFFQKDRIATNLEKYSRSLTWDNIDLLTEEALYSSSKLPIIDRHIQLLKLIVNLAPLLGLLGTVIGIVRSTGGIISQDQNELLLGVSESLVTTAMGLIVSIPALLTNFYANMKKDQLFFYMKKELSKEL